MLYVFTMKLYLFVIVTQIFTLLKHLNDFSIGIRIYNRIK